MSEDRIARLEAENLERAVDIGSLKTSVEHLNDSVQRLTVAVEGLSSTASEGRGALGMVVLVATLFGGAISAALTKWLSGT